MTDLIAFLLWLTGQPPQEPNDPGMYHTNGGGIPVQPVPTSGTGG